MLNLNVCVNKNLLRVHAHLTWCPVNMRVCAQIAVTHNGQIQYFPISTEQQIVSPEELEAAAHSAVTGMNFFFFFYLLLYF